MYKINFSNPVYVHFIGIGGISMSGLAEILLSKNFTISGSDSKESEITNHLKSLGAKINIGQSADNINDNIDVVVYTSAIHKDNPEFAQAVKKGIPLMKRSTLLGEIMDNFKDSIAISGTHGKTTTTSMISHIFLQAKKDPTISVGGLLDAIKGNIRIGNSSSFITEACEYTNSFLDFYPKVNIILNIDVDHLDFFKDLDDIRLSFKKFANNTANDGLLIINSDIENISYITENLKCKIITFGSNKTSDYSATNITFDDLGNGHYDLVENGNITEHIDLSVKGLHNIYNSLSAIITAKYFNISMEDIKLGLLSFSGTKRRFEYKGKFNNITIIDDYAHHPTEIKATLNSAKLFTHNEIWCVFQPHTFSRTKALLNEFAEALSICDHIILADIYSAREIDTGEIHSKDILKKLESYNVDSYYFPSFEKIEDFLIKNCKDNDLLITMGAGDVYLIGEKLIKDK